MISLEELDFAQYSRLDVTKDDMRDNITEKFLIGFYKNGSQKEFGITFYNENGKKVIKLEAAKDSWGLLNEFRELLRELSNISEADIEPQDIYVLLTKLGLKDITDNLNNPNI